jgi:hypothetical protein
VVSAFASRQAAHHAQTSNAASNHDYVRSFRASAITRVFYCSKVEENNSSLVGREAILTFDIISVGTYLLTTFTATKERITEENFVFASK